MAIDAYRAQLKEQDRANQEALKNKMHPEDTLEYRALVAEKQLKLDKLYDLITSAEKKEKLRRKISQVDQRKDEILAKYQSAKQPQSLGAQVQAPQGKGKPKW